MSKRFWQIVIVGIVLYGIYNGVAGHTQMSKLSHDLQLGSPDRQIAAAKELMARDRLFDQMQEMPRVARMRILRTVIRRIPDELTVKQCLILLKDPRITVRNRVAAALVVVGKGHIGVLVPALKDSDENVRKGVGNALVAIGPPVIRNVQEAVKDPDLRGAACDVLVRIGPPSIPAFAQLLEDKDQDVRMAAAGSLGKINNKDSTPALMKATGDIPAVRRIAVSSLANICDPRAIDVFVQVLGNTADEGEVRARAARSLSVIGGQKAVAALVGALNDFDLKVRTSVISGLQRIGAPAVAPVVSAMSGSTDLRYRGATVLEKINSPEAAQTLLKLAADADPQIRLSAARGLGEQRTAPQVAALIKLLGDRDGRVADAADDSLAQLGPSAIATLVSTLGSGASEVVKYRASVVLARLAPASVPMLLQMASAGGDSAKYAAYALGQARDRRAHPVLMKLAASADRDLSWTAARALERL